MTTDRELLRQYADEGDEAAFVEVVRRQTNLVYGVAWRVTSDAVLAQDVTQCVFTLLARRAGALSRHVTLVGWLHTTTRFCALAAMRRENRRRAREQEAYIMQQILSGPEADWEQLRPHLDEAMGRLRERDRQAILLRFFNGLSYQEVGAVVGLSENTTQKCIERALEKLRSHFQRRGFITTVALLSTALTTNGAQTAPVGLAENVSTASLTGTASGGAVLGNTLLLTFFMSTKTKITLGIAFLLLLAVLVVEWYSPGKASFEARWQGTVAPAAAVSPATPNLPKALPSPVQVAAPVVAAAPASTVADPVVWSGNFTQTSATGVPVNAELKTAIPDLIRALEAQDWVGVVKYAKEPDEVKAALNNGQTLEQIGDHLRTELEGHGGAGNLLQALQAIQNLTPVEDSTGNHARYELAEPVAGHQNLEFERIGGVWYLH